MNQGYRDVEAVCPGCHGELVPREAAPGAMADPGAIIDICKDCEGIWVDWFDGDLATVAARPPSPDRPPPIPPSERSGARSPACPRCRRPLARESYAGDGPSILRCSECVGAFVPRASAAALVHFSPEDRPLHGSDEDSFFQKVLERIRAALGLTTT